jgi:hypothetical protein
MTAHIQSTAAVGTMECPLCRGEGELKRAEVLERLGVRDLARVAQLSAEEAFRLLLGKHQQDEQNNWMRFESELAKRLAKATTRHEEELQSVRNEKNALEFRMQTIEKFANDQKAAEVVRVRIELEGKLRSAQSDKEDLNRRVEDYFRELSQLRERNQVLEAEMAKVARVGKREELDFAEEARSWPGIYVSEKLQRHGDYLLAYRDPSGAELEPRMVIDNKDKSAITEGDIKKLVRDAKERRGIVGIIVAKEEGQLRQLDRESRWGREDGIWLLRTTRQWLPRDLEVLKPVFERMRTEGPDFLQTNALLAEEIRRTFIDLDEIEKELKKASKAIDVAAGLTTKYKTRLQALCDHSSTPKKPPVSQQVSGLNCKTVGA